MRTRSPWPVFSRLHVLPILAVILAAPLLFAACEGKDTSLTTSPSVLAMIGTTVGNTEFNATGQPPAVQDPAADWQVELGQASWTKLENGTPAIMVVLSMTSQPGAGMEVWLTKDGDQPQTIAHWFGGSSAVYEGTVCFRITTEQDGARLDIDPDSHYSLAVDFIDPTAGVVASQARPVAGNTPHLEGHAPGPDDIVFANTYACPKGQ